MSKSASNFEGNDIEEWLKHFRLELLRPLFFEVGVESCEDLVDIYENEEMMSRVEAMTTPIEFLRFRRSRAQTRILVDEPKSALKKVTFADDSVNPLFAPKTVYKSVSAKNGADTVSFDEEVREKVFQSWTCSFCKNANGIEEKNCAQCKQPNLEMKLRKSSSTSKSSPWACQSCGSLNVSGVDKCETCQIPKISVVETSRDFSPAIREERWYHPGAYAKGFMGMTGSWMCCGAKERKSVECQFGIPSHHPGRWETGNAETIKAESKVVARTTKMDPHDIRQRRKDRRCRQFEKGWQEYELWKCCLSCERDAVGCAPGPHPNPLGEILRLDSILGHK